jgi:hypothetical protein
MAPAQIQLAQEQLAQEPNNLERQRGDSDDSILAVPSPLMVVGSKGFSTPVNTESRMGWLPQLRSLQMETGFEAASQVDSLGVTLPASHSGAKHEESAP